MRINPKLNHRIGCVVFLVIAIVFIVFVISSLKYDPVFQQLLNS